MNSTPTLLVAALRDGFNVRARELIPQQTSSHNEHYVVPYGNEDLHVTVRGLRHSVDTLEELEFVARFEKQLSSPTAKLVNTNRPSRSGHYLLPIDDAHHVAVRSHRGLVCTRTHSLHAMIFAAVQHGTAVERHTPVSFRTAGRVLRYAAPNDAIPAIRERVIDFVARHEGPTRAKRLLAELNTVAAAVTSSTTRPRLVHGDLSFQNMIEDGGTLQIIDHDCLHYDHPLYDIGHLMLSVACTGYFSGQLEKQVADEFITTACRIAPHVARRDLCETASYVLLKKTALVRTPINLRLEERIAILDGLRSLM